MKLRACASEASGTPILRAMSSACASVRPAAGIDGDLVDLLRRVGGDFLDFHAALGARHQRDALRGAIDDHADVQFLADVRALFHQQPLHHRALRDRSDG